MEIECWSPNIVEMTTIQDAASTNLYVCIASGVARLGHFVFPCFRSARALDLGRALPEKKKSAQRPHWFVADFRGKNS